MFGLCPPPPPPPPHQSIHNRRQFRSVSPPLVGGQFRLHPMANFGPSTRPHAFTTGALDGLQMDWCKRHQHHSPQQQLQKHQQMLFRPKQLPARRRVSPFSTQTLARPFSPPAVCHQTLAQPPIFSHHSPSSCAQQAEQNLRQFLRLCDDRQFPVRFVAVNGTQRSRLEWRLNPGQMTAMERRELIRQFAIGLPVQKQPYSLLAIKGLKDVLSTPNGPGDLADSLTIVIPQLRLALNSEQMWKKMESLDFLREMAQLEGIGPKLVPFFRMLLPPLRVGFVRRASADLSGCQQDQLVNSIDRTLLTLEQKGGPKAAINIKYLIPEYRPFYSSDTIG